MTGRLGRVAAVLAGLLVFNLLVYAVGRTAGGAFTYRQGGADVRVEAVAVTVMSLGPLGSGLALTALLARWWPAVVRVALIVAPLLAVATIAVMTLPAGFDTTSTVSLMVMHLALIPASLLALRPLGSWNRDYGRTVRPRELRSGPRRTSR